MSERIDSMPWPFRHWQGRLTKALVLEDPDPILDEELRKMGIEVERISDAPTEPELCRILEKGQHHLLYKRSKVEITEAVVQASRNLGAVFLCCIGDDSVDKAACARHGVMVMNDPVSNGRSVAELVIGELVSLSRRLFDSVLEMRESVWRKDSRARYELLGKRIGILGLGKIGRQVAQLSQAMGMQVVYFDTGEVAREVGLAMGWSPAESIEALFRASDFVTVHVSATDVHGRGNEDLLTDQHFAAFADGDADSPRIFLNLARGFVVPPDVLRRAVDAGHVRYAITDVFPEEPGKSSTTAWQNPYGGEPRIFSTPHIGAATREAQPRIARYIAGTTRMWNELGMFRNCVFRPRASIEFEVEYATCMLAVVHVDKRGTKKAVDDAIFAAGASNVRSAHVDFPDFGIAYDLSALDRELTAEETRAIASEAIQLTGAADAIRWVRTIPVLP